MVLILGRRTTREESTGTGNPPAVKRKVFEMQPKNGGDVLDISAAASHGETLLQVLDEFRASQTFTDVVVSVQGREFPCHRAVLSACSVYFRAMFCNDHRESRATLVEINGIQAGAMETFLQYVYSGRACITTHNVQYLFEASSLFQIAALRDACASFLEEQMDPCNCLGLQRFADTHSLKQLAARCRAYALHNFPEVAQHEEFLDLQQEELEEHIANDELCVPREEVVFEAVMRWVYHSVEHRRAQLRDLLRHVRLPLLHPNYFIQKVEGDQLIQNAPECYQLLHEARRYHVLGNEMMSPRTRPRRSTGFSEVIVVVGGCERVGTFSLPYTECYDPFTGEWRSLAKHPEFTKSEYAVCALRNDLLVSGGRINSSYVWMYNSQLNLWIRVASLSKGRWRHKMCVLLGKAYAVGGYDGQSCLSSVEVYDSFSNRWAEVAPLTVAVSSPAVAGCTGRLLVMGGEPDEHSCSDKVQCYDPEMNSWLLRANLPVAKRNITAVSLNNLVYVCGGLTKCIYCYDPAKDFWMAVVNTFSRQECCGMSVCNGKIFVLGGRGENGESTDSILCYDPSSSIITSVAAMPRPISHHGCITIHRYTEKLHRT
ncbi:hypothetical protein P4O66_014783 [Electrophorus voltai]|uniref:BTB domain-containing protein n=1 Tax=Electrophorus voltai TaxID=2609070 RepID=A0AAD8Z1X1_9TELE|nr:hypothetical protein P4O66_014783 [Electrophorus voltai]